jgi:hypothetical protein
MKEIDHPHWGGKMFDESFYAYWDGLPSRD